MRLSELFFLNLLCYFVSAKVTDKQYASMPELFYMENYDQCMLLGDEALYCYFTYHIEPIDPGNETAVWQVIQEVNTNDMNYKHDLLRRWICVPFSCPKMENASENDIIGTGLERRLKSCYDGKYESYGFKGEIENLKCEGIVQPYPVDWLDILVGFLFVSYIAFVLYASYFEVVASHGPIEAYQRSITTGSGRILAAFSISRNWDRIKAVKEDAEVESLKHIQGVRFYNTLLVIMSHTSLSIVSGPVANVRYIETMTERVGNLFMSSGGVCVSTFFFISSFFLIKGILEQFKEKQLSFNHLFFIFFNRYLRLTPVFAFLVLFYATWWRHLGGGPHWNRVIGLEYQRCRKNGWTNLLFLNNLIDNGNMCMAHTWYLALDTQYFALLLLIIWYIKKQPRMTYPVIAAISAITTFGTFIENYVGNYEALVIPRPESVYEMKSILKNPQWHSQMSGFLGNTAGSITGLFFGYRYVQNRNKLFHKQKSIYQKICYIVLTYGLALSATLLPGVFVFMTDCQKDPLWASFNVALGRQIFSIAIGYTIYKAIFGIGWAALYIMKWHPVCILGRLSYSAYLVHVTVNMSRAAIQRHPVYISDVYIAYQLVADITVSYMLALLLTLFIEMPVSDLQKMLTPPKKNAGQTQKNDSEDERPKQH